VYFRVSRANISGRYRNPERHTVSLFQSRTDSSVGVLELFVGQSEGSSIKELPGSVDRNLRRRRIHTSVVNLNGRPPRITHAAITPPNVDLAHATSDLRRTRRDSDPVVADTDGALPVISGARNDFNESLRLGSIAVLNPI
jgi:hypothetical protein